MIPFTAASLSPQLPTALIFGGFDQRAVGFVWGRWSSVARLQVLMSSPLRWFEKPCDSGRHLRGDGGMQVFTFSILQTQPAYVPVLVKTMAMQGWEERPHQKGTKVLTFPKGTGLVRTS